MSKTQVMWLCCTGERAVGLVKQYDEIERRWKYYIGIGDGLDPDADVAKILAMGQKYYSLAEIASFEESTTRGTQRDGCELYEPKLVFCCDCKHQIKKWHRDGRMKEGGYTVYSCGRNEDPFVCHTVNGYDDEFCSHGITRCEGGSDADHCVRSQGIR